MKRTIRLTESELHGLIRECIEEVIYENFSNSTGYTNYPVNGNGIKQASKFPVADKEFMNLQRKYKMKEKILKIKNDFENFIRNVPRKLVRNLKGLYNTYVKYKTHRKLDDADREFINIIQKYDVDKISRAGNMKYIPGMSLNDYVPQEYNPESNSDVRVFADNTQEDDYDAPLPTQSIKH